MEFGDTVKMHDVPANEFFYGGGYIFKARKSGEVYSHSFAPNMCVMQVYEILEGDEQDLKVGQLLEDFFNSDFMYIGSKKAADITIEYFKNEVLHKGG